MERHLEATTHVRAPLARIRNLLRDDPGSVISDHVSPDDRLARRFTTEIGPRSESGTLLGQEVVVELGRMEDRGDGIHLPLTWHPVGHERLLPSFEGELSAAGTEGARTRVVLEGDYRVPMGLVGRVGDSIMGQRVARQSITGLLQEIAERVDRAVDQRTKETVQFTPAPYPVDLRESPHSEYHLG